MLMFYALSTSTDALRRSVSTEQTGTDKNVKVILLKAISVNGVDRDGQKR